MHIKTVWDTLHAYLHSRKGLRWRKKELYSVGYESLLKALEDYTPDRGMTLKTYISRRVEWGLKDYMRSETQWSDNHWMCGSPTDMEELPEKGYNFELGSTYDGPDTQKEEEHYVKTIREILDNLSKRDKYILLEYMMANRKGDDVAEELNITSNNLRVQANRIKNKIIKLESNGRIHLYGNNQ